MSTATQPTGHVATPTDEPAATSDTDERMLTLTYQVCRLLGRSRGATMRLCRRLLSTTPTGHEDRRIARTGEEWRARVAARRRERARFVAALRAELMPRVNLGRLDDALHTAALWDEVTLLPPRQRFALRSAMVEHQTVADIAKRAGWTQSQVTRLLRVALRTITLHANLGDASTDRQSGTRSRVPARWTSVLSAPDGRSQRILPSVQQAGSLRTEGDHLSRRQPRHWFGKEASRVAAY